MRKRAIAKTPQSVMPVELYLIGSDANKRLTPFIADLAEDPQSVSAETSITARDHWSLAPPKHLGGTVLLNMGVFHQLRGRQRSRCPTERHGHGERGFQSFSAETEPGSSSLLKGRAPEADIDLIISTSGSSNIEVELTVQAVLFSVPAADAKLEFSGAANQRIPV